MMEVYLGAILFGLPHLAAIVFPDLRNKLIARLGEGPFKGLYSLLSLAGLGLLVWAYLASELSQRTLYQPWTTGKHLQLLMVLIAFILLAASHGKGHIRLLVQHPMSFGTLLWAGAHLLANGELTLIWLFGTVFVVALADLVFSLLRGKRPDYVPNITSDIRAIATGIVLYLVFLLGFHPFILHVPVI